jgi:hypothetical protein
MTGQCPLCGKVRELREIDGAVLCSEHVSRITWERRSTLYPRDRATSPPTWRNNEAPAL